MLPLERTLLMGLIRKQSSADRIIRHTETNTFSYRISYPQLRLTFEVTYDLPDGRVIRLINIGAYDFSRTPPSYHNLDIRNEQIAIDYMRYTYNFYYERDNLIENVLAMLRR